jgi:hypothetical protein
MTVTVNVISKRVPMAIELAFIFGNMAVVVHMQKIALYLATIQSRLFIGRNEALRCPVIFAIVASNQSNGRATDRSIVRNAESLPKEKIGVKETANIRKENDDLRTKIRVLSVILADSNDSKSMAIQ